MKQYNARKKGKKKVLSAIFFIISLFFVGIALSVAVLGYTYMTNREFKETFYCVNSLKANNKIRVIQISDLHNTVYGNNNDTLIDRVQKLKPDIIIYTGDGVEAGRNENIIALCTALADVAPSYYIYGNNEVEMYYDGPLTQTFLDKKFQFDDSNRDPQKLLEITDPLTEKLEEVGVKVLKNASDTITVGKTTVDIYGVLTSNPSAFWSYAGESFDAYIYTNESHLKITAIHEPHVFEVYTPDTWGDLLLAGHTHGGIARIPVLGPVYTHEGGLFPERNGCYVYGRSDVRGRPLIVSSGLENSDYFRINNQPEIVIVDINKF